MFNTYLDGEINYPDMTLGLDEKSWDYIQLGFDMYWFLVKIINDSDDGPIQNTLLIAKLEKLIELEKNKKVKILDTYLVHHGWFTNSTEWKMEPICQIFEGREPNLKSNQISYIFILKDKKRYVSSSLSTSEIDLLDKKLLFNFRTG